MIKLNLMGKMERSNLLKKSNTNDITLPQTTVGVYNSHREALDAIVALQKAGLPLANISFMSTAVMVADNLQTYSTDNIKNTPVAIGAVLGPLLGILTGVSIIAFPGLGFLYGAGAIVGAVAGFDIGILGGGIGTLLMTLGISKENVLTYHKHLTEGKYLVVLQGNKETADKAKKIVHNIGNYIELVII